MHSSEDSHAGSANAERRLHMLKHTSALLGVSPEFDDMLAHTLSACLPELGNFGFLDVVVDGGVRRAARAQEDPEIEEILRSMPWMQSESTDINLCALSSGRPALHTGIDDDWYRRVAVDDDHLALLRRLAFGSMLTVPMRYRGELIGALTLFMARSGRGHEAADLAFAEELLLVAAAAVANVRLLETPTSAARRQMPMGAAVPNVRLLETQRKAEMALRLSEERLRMATDAGRRGIWDEDLVPDRANRSPIDMTGRTALLAAEHEARANAAAAKRRVELLLTAGSLFAQSLKPDETLNTIASLLVPCLADWCSVDLIDAAGLPQNMLTYHADPATAQRGRELTRRWCAPATVPGSIAWVISKTLPSMMPKITDEELKRLGNEEVAAEMKELQLCASLCVPLAARGRTLGALTLAQAESGRSFNEDDLILLTELAQRAALALDNARLYAETELARRDAERVSRTKDEFLAMLGHELRNPLAPIVTALELMDLRGEASTQYERGVIGRQVEHLTRLVDDLLDISRITHGKIKFKLELLSIVTVLDKAVELIKPTFAKNQLDFDYEPPDEAICVVGDTLRLLQVFGNLLGNAAKFTPPGGRVWLRVQARDGVVTVSVGDSGIGIAPELLPQVFELFVQGPQHINRQADGLGLGLPIAKTLVNMHGGHIRAESEGVQQGSTFYVELPQVLNQMREAQAPASAPRPAAVQSARILVVDDNVDAGETLTALLSASGFDVRHAVGGAEALRLVESFAPELAVLDLGLPAMDGYELARRLRAAVPGPLRLVALTGYGGAHDATRAQAAGFDRHSTKPVNPVELIALIAELLPRHPPS